MTQINSLHNRAVTYVPRTHKQSMIATVLHWVAANDRQFRKTQKRVDATAGEF